MPKSLKPASIPTTQRAGACDSFAEWRQNKRFVVGGPLMSPGELKANARKLRSLIEGQDVAL